MSVYDCCVLSSGEHEQSNMPRYRCHTPALHALKLVYVPRWLLIGKRFTYPFCTGT